MPESAEAERLLVARERARRAAIDVPRELVEQQDQAQPPARAIGPRVELAVDAPAASAARTAS